MSEKQAFPPQHQEKQPGLEYKMTPQPDYYRPKKDKKLENKVALITGGDSGIGRAIAVLFAQEGCDIVIVYLDEHKDAEDTKKEIEKEKRKCITISGDVKSSKFCDDCVKKCIDTFGKLDILVNNAAEQHVQESILDISDEQIDSTFRTNIYAYFYFARAAVKVMKENSGCTIINSTSVTAYKGNKQLLDYSSTKGAIVTFTRSLATQLVEKGIRVNGVAPGPILTPLIPSTFPADKVATFGTHVPMKRAGQPNELAPSYLFLACEDSSYVTGTVIHVNGGDIINC